METIIRRGREPSGRSLPRNFATQHTLRESAGMTITVGPSETVALGRRLAAEARPGDVWALVGDLGAGKTHFVQGVAAGLGAGMAATSPTFTLVHEYTDGRLPVFHLDFYRLESAAEALALGWEEYLDEGGGLTLVEWADKFPALLPPGTRWLRFEIGKGDERRIVEEREHAR